MRALSTYIAPVAEQSTVERFHTAAFQEVVLELVGCETDGGQANETIDILMMNVCA